MDAAVFFSFVDQAPFQFSGLVTVDVPGLPLARWSATEGVPPRAGAHRGRDLRQPHGHLHRAAEQRDVDALPPVTTLLDVARRQIERAGGAPDLDTGNTGSGERASRRIPSWRRRCRPTRLPGSGSRSPTLSGVDEIPAVGIDRRSCRS